VIETAFRDAVRRARTLGRAVACVVVTPVADEPDLVDLFAQATRQGERRFLLSHGLEGRALLGLGCAHEFTDRQPLGFDAVAGALRRGFAEAVIRPSGARAAAVGGFAFEPREPDNRAEEWRRFGDGRFALPEIALLRQGDRLDLQRAWWLTPDDDPVDAGRRARARWAALLHKDESLSPRLAESRVAPGADDAYLERVRRALREMDRCSIDKVVVAGVWQRPVAVPHHVSGALRHIRSALPESLVFAQGIGAHTFLGATPERILRCTGGALETHAVAGTSAAQAPPSALLDSAKERHEHALVVEHLLERLKPMCTSVAPDTSPRLLAGGRIRHLCTRIRATLSRESHLLEVLARLHPTPALAGTPPGPALELIRRLEPFDRGWYGGPVGFIDSAGDGDFFVALRCGLVSGGTVRLYAGSGVVPESDPAREAEETALKLSTLWEAFDSA
jgi:salicylate biosynthesis isochorismate synthase